MLYKSQLDFYALNENNKLVFVGQIAITDSDHKSLFARELAMLKWMSSPDKRVVARVNFGTTNRYNFGKMATLISRVYEYHYGNLIDFRNDFNYEFEVSE